MQIKKIKWRSQQNGLKKLHNFAVQSYSLLINVPTASKSLQFNPFHISFSLTSRIFNGHGIQHKIKKFTEYKCIMIYGLFKDFFF